MNSFRITPWLSSFTIKSRGNASPLAISAAAKACSIVMSIFSPDKRKPTLGGQSVGRAIVLHLLNQTTDSLKLRTIRRKNTDLIRCQDNPTRL